MIESPAAAKIFSEGGGRMSNTDVRLAAKRAGVKLWEIADELGIQDSAFSRKLRKELPKEEKEWIFEIIERLSKEVS